MKTIESILQNKSFSSNTEVCPGCENHCTVRTFSFGNGQRYFSGNQCEKVYSNSKTHNTSKGVNMFAEKYKLLFSRSTQSTAKNTNRSLRIGIPRGLGIYEDYLFWHTLLTECGIEVVLSRGSSNSLYEKGVRSIVADNICFPAKLMHGHILDLIERKVDRILYPWVVYERKEDEHSGNSFNCPVVSGYSDVINSSISTNKNYDIPLDAPVINFANTELLVSSCIDYLSQFGLSTSRIKAAVAKAQIVQQVYLDEVEARCMAVLEQAEKDNRPIILLAARPYHTDPMIEHRISQSIADMGIDVITENIATHAGADVYNKINAVSQWAYPNRIFKAAYFVGKHHYKNLHFVELTSFGCGPDAFILDEVRTILSRFDKNLTVLKIDDVNNIGSLKLRVRSMIESMHHSPIKQKDINDQEPWTTKHFMAADRQRTILIPHFADGYSEYLVSAFAAAGYKCECLPMGNKNDAEEGLQDANNDICYPATIVLGSILRALKSDKYDLNNVAIAITQTGGQCRASNYYSLIKNALVQAGFANVPMISVGIGGNIQNSQPGFILPVKKIWRIVMYSMLYADSLMKLYYPAVVRERTKGEAKRLFEHYTAAAQPIVERCDCKGLRQLLKKAVSDFCTITDMDKQTPCTGLVGEIYVKYNSFSNLHVSDWLIEHGVEVIPPSLISFFMTSIPNASINRKLHIKDDSMSPLTAWMINKYIMFEAHRFERICRPFKLFRPFTDINEIYHLSKQVINSAADFGEGWFLPGEICYLAQNGINNVVSVQPFGCIANHIISKGIEKRLKSVYPNLSLLFLDFDAGTSEANVQNRLHFMLNH